MSTIEIHEFSTGINVQGTPDNWWSVGFSGGYMNSTLSYIPRSVQQEIAADLFDLSEFAEQKKPAIIGREVKLGQEEWSVLAVITHAKDESKRGISVSRYFLTEGLGKLNDLLTYQQSNSLKSNSLTFNPFDKKKVGGKVSYGTNKTINTDLLHLLDNHEELIKNILVPSTTTTKTGQRIPLKAIHQLAEKKAKELKQLVSWAYDVEGLKKPHDFLIIYPAAATTTPALPPSNSNPDLVANLSNTNAPNGVHQEVFRPQLPPVPNPQTAPSVTPPSSPVTPPHSPFLSDSDRFLQESLSKKDAPPPRVEGQEEISNIIRSWINNNPPTLKDVEIIENAFKDTTLYDDKFWTKSILEPLDLNKATSDKTYPHIYVYLYLLYGLIIPEKLPDFLTWIENVPKKQKETVYGYIKKLSSDIESQLNSSFPNGYTETAIFKRVKEGVGVLIDQNNPSKDLKSLIFKIVEEGIGILIGENNSSKDLHSTLLPDELMPDELKKLDSLLSQLSTLEPNPLNFNRSETSRVRKWFLTEAEGLWPSCYRQYFDFVRKDGETFKQNLWQDIKQIARNYKTAKAKLDEDIKQGTGSRNSMTSPQDIANALQNRGYQLTYASENLNVLNQKDLQDIKDYFINLIWYHGRKSESLSLYESNKQLLKDLAKVFGAMIKYKEDHKINTDTKNDYTPLAVITQILENDVPTDLWKKCGFIVNLGKEDKIALTPEGDQDVTIISLKRKPLWFEPFIPYIIPLLITLLLLLQGASLVFIFALKQQIKSANQELQLMTELTLPDGLDKIVNDLDQDQKIDKTKSKKAIIKLFKLQKSLSKQKEINWKQLIEDYQKEKNIKPTGIVGIKSDSQTREAIIKDIKVSLGLSTPSSPSPSPSVSPSPSPSVSPSPSPSPSPATDWNATVKAIDALRDEFVSMPQDKSTVEAAIIKNIAAGFVYKYKAERQKEWTPKIKKFQKENSIIETGSISQNDETYKALKCKVAKELELTDQVPDCPANSD